MHDGPALDSYVFAPVAADIDIAIDCWGAPHGEHDLVSGTITAGSKKTPSELKAEALNPKVHSAIVTVSGGRFKCFPGGAARSGSDDFTPADVGFDLPPGTYMIGAVVPEGIRDLNGFVAVPGRDNPEVILAEAEFDQVADDEVASSPFHSDDSEGVVIEIDISAVTGTPAINIEIYGDEAGSGGRPRLGVVSIAPTAADIANGPFIAQIHIGPGRILSQDSVILALPMSAPIEGLVNAKWTADGVVTMAMRSLRK